jgi:signal peptidase II
MCAGADRGGVGYGLKPHHHLILWPAAATVFVDQLSKFFVLKHVPLQETIPVIEGFFHLVHVRNRGIAFGLLNRPGIEIGLYLLIAASIGAVALLLVWSLRLEDRNQRILPGLSLIVGGAIGNLIDRVRLGEVVDFLDFFVGSYHWPAFNVADCAITLGTLWVALLLLFQGKHTSKTQV